MIEYKEDWLLPLVFRLKGSLTCRACLFAIPSSSLSLFLVWIDDWFPDFREAIGLLSLNKSQLWTAMTSVLVIMLAFRTNRAMARFWEGTGLLHQMRGEWFDSVSCCVTFSTAAAKVKPREVKIFRHTIVRLMSLCHGSALEEIAGYESDDIETIDAYGLDNATLKHLRNSKERLGFNRVEVLLHLTQSLITKALEDRVLEIPPPILSRVYQTLSRGFVNLLNAKKIADTRFPFPFAQIITMLLLAHVFMTPVLLSCLVHSKVWAPLFTFVPIFSMFYLDFVGVELEHPFGKDDNDLPLERFQSEMNNCLLMLLHGNADLIAGISDERCITNFDTLHEAVQESNQILHHIAHRSSNKFVLKPSNTRISTFNLAEIDEESGNVLKRRRHAVGTGSQLRKVSETPSQVGRILSESPNQVGTSLSERASADRHMFSERASNERFPHSRLSFLDPTDSMAFVGRGSEGLEPVEECGEQEDSFHASLFICSADTPRPEPAQPVVQAEVPKKAARGGNNVLLEVANGKACEMIGKSPRPVKHFQGNWEIFEPGNGTFPSAGPISKQGHAQQPVRTSVTFREDMTSHAEISQSSKSYTSSRFSTELRKASSVVLGKDAGVKGKPIQPDMEQFHEALHQWTHLIEDQLGELRHHVVGMKRFSDHVNSLQESTSF